MIRSFELELFCAVNILQFVFLALKLDGIIPWSWEITFIPLWIVLCISLVGVLYTIIFAGILLRMPDVNADQRRSSTNSALGYRYGSLNKINQNNFFFKSQFSGCASPRLLGATYK